MMTFIYELGPYYLEVNLMRENELNATRISKVIV